MGDKSVEDSHRRHGTENEPDRPALSADGQWRADYRKAQHQRRLAGIQPDLFGGPAIEHRYRNAPHPLQDGWMPDYEIERFQDHPRPPHAQAHHAALFEGLIGGSPMPTLRNVRIDLDPVDRATITAALIFWRDAETRPNDLEYLSCGLANSPPSMRRVSTS
ncbi:MULTISPECIES: hypothetical protein [Rhizobium]|uniref:Uncharacterized protein n=1 Tax=Rhizobium lentis TaxID=1138194 RepID=A0A9Q3MBZ8_9HYPH|nr:MULTISPECIES: hypothetical protein [Rhizobium]MBX4898965.1 hypothetical protein [Rhizobium bangladeshense]MBX4959733.1 hypothetical protein [Rhizobium lentis]MBX4968838.1 hypothetical protein [Rhizobium binae]MBX4977777.1 hypothetical protein [Rhizobium lentis]MBX4987898.1 hypothetical protein [Rhizobium lentis]